MAKPISNARMFLVGAGVFVLFGLFLLPWSVWSRSRVEAMAKWPTVNATVVSADTRWVYRKNEGVRYQHRLTYHYRINNQNYTGDRMSSSGSPPEWRTEAKARRELPAIGSGVSIQYDRDDPSDSVIYVVRRSESDDQILLWLTVGVSLASGVLMVVAGRAWLTAEKVEDDL
ncbi:MAG: DUF3592 domain-containing protein [Opitutae bacterium]|nr:DUF3592 domain-containing protein [Opitutae bacterium]